MAVSDSNSLIEQANQAASNGEWQKAEGLLLQAYKTDPENAGIMIGLGTCNLQLNNGEEAVNYFKQAMDLMGESADLYCNLGIAYGASGLFKEAEEAYQKAIELSPAHLLSMKSLAVIYLKQNDKVGLGLKLLVDTLKAHPDDFETVLMLASYYALAEQFEEAQKLTEYVLKFEPENPQAKEIMRIIEERTGKPKENRVVKPEHARKLAALKTLKTDRTAAGKSPEPAPEPQTKPEAPEILQRQVLPAGMTGFRSSQMQSNVCFYAGEEFAVGVRLYTPAKALERLGYRMKYSNKVEPTDFQTYDTFVFSRPHLDQAWVDAYTTCMQQGKRIIIDIDEDFHNLPTDHPGFNVLGQGNPSALNVFERLLERADLVTVSSKTLGDRYATFTRQIKYIPTSWDSENQLWHKPAQRHKTFNIGWVEYASEVPNLMIMREELVRFLQNHDDVLFILGGDLKALDLFQGVNEDKFLYLPFVSYEDFPFLLSYFDVMISPLRKSGYNLSKSDTHLMEAGARRMPWIASKIPSYEDWAEGGLFADKGEEWYKALKTLYMDVDMRHSLGEAGHRKAEDHDVRAVISQWQNVLG